MAGINFPLLSLQLLAMMKVSGNFLHSNFSVQSKNVSQIEMNFFIRQIGANKFINSSNAVLFWIFSGWIKSELDSRRKLQLLFKIYVYFYHKQLKNKVPLLISFIFLATLHILG